MEELKPGVSQPLPAKTTEQEDLTKAGQRNINLMWERTQSKIAMMVIIAGLFVNGLVVIILVLSNREMTVNQLAVISVCLQFINMIAGIVIGFYFGRTNHDKTGGVGQKTTLSGVDAGRGG